MRSLLPVGLPGYLSPTQAAPMPLTAGNSQPGNAETVHAHAGTSSTQQQPWTSRQQVLGYHAAAAWQPGPGLPGMAGILRPSWIQVRVWWSTLGR